jgi:hypothetical protein
MAHHMKWLLLLTTTLLLGCSDYDACHPGDYCGVDTSCLATFFGGHMCTKACRQNSDCPEAPSAPYGVVCQGPAEGNPGQCLSIANPETGDCSAKGTVAAFPTNFCVPNPDAGT